MPHAAYIAWGFPPSRSGGAYRQLATANALAAAGWEVSVLTVERSVFTGITGADLSLESQIDPRLRLIRTRFPWPLRNPDRATWSLAHRLAPRVWRKARALAELAVFPEVGYAGWLGELRRALRALHRQRPVDLVVASANPYVAFAAAYFCHRRWGLPFVMDYRDAWSLDVFSGEAAFGRAGRRARLERRYLAAGAQAWFVNQPIKQWYAERYPEAAARFRVVANGWDPELLGARAGAPSGGGRPLAFGYLGTVSGKVPLGELLAGWRLARRSGALGPDATLKVAGYLGFFGSGEDRAGQDAAAQLAQAAADGVAFAGPVAKAQVAEFYAGLDGLVLALGPGRYVTSGKVYEYMATGKPIVSVHPPESAACAVLEGYPLWARAAALTPEAVAAALGQAARLAANLTPAQAAQARAHGARFTRQRQLGPALAQLPALLARTS
ncbi:MAG: glycosyltransferase [Bifidobacteriaceae bacterium]|nr:glycosyltransferase [Bifidobacteriaceae bacterium]